MNSCCDEYCSNHGCNQGRDCPVRVARIGRRHPADAPLPPNVWRAQLRVLARWVLLIVGMLLCAALLGTVAACSEQRTYDCSMASFHPDFPKKLRDECRKRFST